MPVAAPKTTLPVTEKTTATVERLIAFEHPFPEKQTHSARMPLNDARRIGMYAIRTAYGIKNRIYLTPEVNFHF